MYLQYFGLAEAPFSIAPDPRYLYMSKRHQEALAHLLYGLRGDGGFVLLTGEVGAGKTTVCRCLLEQIPDTCDVAYIFNPRLTVEELLSALCEEFGIACPPNNTSIKTFVDCLNAYLLDAHARGRQTVLIIDEAQNLSGEVLEQMRLLTNLETNQRKLLQIVLLGQPELVDLLDRPELRQLSQRIVARYHLGPLNKEEVAAYLAHRLEVSGVSAGTKQLFPRSLIGPIYRLSGGVPRLLNVLCDRALLGTFAQGKQRVDRATLMQAAEEVFPRPMARRRQGRQAIAVAALLATMTLAVGVTFYRDREAQGLSAAKPVALPATPAAKNKAEAEPPLEPVLAWPADENRSDSRRQSLAALFATWGVEYQGPDSCRQLALAGLECRSGRGSFAELRRMNRPAVLSIREAHGRDAGFSVMLTNLDDRGATVSMGSKVMHVALTALADQWTGNYFMLWHKPPEARTLPRKGDKGPAVAWLDRQLALSEGRVPEAADPIFDDGMIRRLKRFQLSQYLEPSGTLSQKTLIRLAALGDKESPTLLAGSGEHP